MSLVWCSNRCKEVPAIYTGSSAMKLERWLTMSRQQAGLQIRLWGQWGATFRWAEPQSRSLSRGDTQQLSTKATTVKRKTWTRGEQRTERALYWHTAEAADAIWHPAQWRGKSTQRTVTVHSVDDLFPAEKTNGGRWCKQRRLGYLQGLVVKGQTGTVDSCHPLQGADLTWSAAFRVHAGPKHSDQMCHYVIRWRVKDGGEGGRLKFLCGSRDKH